MSRKRAHFIEELTIEYSGVIPNYLLDKDEPYNSSSSVWS